MLVKIKNCSVQVKRVKNVCMLVEIFSKICKKVVEF